MIPLIVVSSDEFDGIVLALQETPRAGEHITLSMRNALDQLITRRHRVARVHRDITVQSARQDHEVIYLELEPR